MSRMTVEIEPARTAEERVQLVEAAVEHNNSVLQNELGNLRALVDHLTARNDAWEARFAGLVDRINAVHKETVDLITQDRANHDAQINVLIDEIGFIATALGEERPRPAAASSEAESQGT